MSQRTVILVDGENLVARFEALVKRGRKPRSGVIHLPGVLVWVPAVLDVNYIDVSRVSYYQTVVGDDTKLRELQKQICEVPAEWSQTEDLRGSGRLIPRLFKKENRNQKNKSVDINITVDALRHAHNNSSDVVWLFSGDADYLPLIEEIMRSGRQVWLAAFSDGLSPFLPHAVDEFFDLDEYAFENTAATERGQS